MSEQDTVLWSSWERCWLGVGAQRVNEPLFKRLIAAYDEPHRKYHTLQHLTECLVLFECHRNLAAEPDEIELALWFHDAIYSVRASDNEAKSAQWAADAMQDAGIAQERIARVKDHVLATQHAALAKESDQQLLVDIDLAILGSAEQRFDAYEQQVRDEYHWVPDFLFRRKRREILAGFLARKSIYGTPALHESLEAKARANLARSLSRLGG